MSFKQVENNLRRIWKEESFNLERLCVHSSKKLNSTGRYNTTTITFTVKSLNEDEMVTYDINMMKKVIELADRSQCYGMIFASEENDAERPEVNRSYSGLRVLLVKKNTIQKDKINELYKLFSSNYWYMMGPEVRNEESNFYELTKQIRVLKDFVDSLKRSRSLILDVNYEFYEDYYKYLDATLEVNWYFVKTLSIDHLLTDEEKEMLQNIQLAV